jgi:hypothetical protein
MRFYGFFAGLACATLFGARAWAGSATAEGARELEQGYAAYLGRPVVDKGILTVAPDDDAYEVTWDLQRAVELSGLPPGAVTVGNLTYRLAAGDGGSWTLTGEHFPRIAFNFRSDKGQASGAFDFDGANFGGRYDPRAPDFLRSTLGVSTLQGGLRMEDGDQRGEFAITEDGLKLEARAQPAASGSGVDLAVAQAVGHINETITVPSIGDETGPNGMTYAMSGAFGGATLSGLRARELGDLWTYVIAHVDRPTKPSDLNDRVRAALPFWNDIRAHADIHDLKVETPDGEARLARLGESLRLTGLTSPGVAEVGVDIEDLEVKSDLAPSWLEQAWPASLRLSLGVSSEGWDEAARIALADPGFGDKADLSPEARARIERALLDGHPRLTLAPGHLKLPWLDLTFSGEAAGGADGLVGHFELSADGLDKAIALLARIGEAEPRAAGAVLVASYLKGLAKTGDDGRLDWRIDIAADGSAKVNGEPMPIGK